MKPLVIEFLRLKSFSSITLSIPRVLFLLALALAFQMCHIWIWAARASITRLPQKTYIPSLPFTAGGIFLPCRTGIYYPFLSNVEVGGQSRCFTPSKCKCISPVLFGIFRGADGHRPVNASLSLSFTVWFSITSWISHLDMSSFLLLRFVGHIATFPTSSIPV